MRASSDKSGGVSDSRAGRLPINDPIRFPTKTSTPFTIGRMVTDPNCFHGRSAELGTIIRRLHNRESTSIVGPRRIGKSSIAYHVMSTCSREFGPTYEFVWLDGQSSHVSTVDQFFKTISKSSSIAYVSGSTPTECLVSFEDAVKAHPKFLVLVINEFEVLTDQSHRDHFKVPFFNTLRHLAEQGFCSLLTTSYTPLQQVCSHVLDVSSPFYNIFEEVPVKHFTDREADTFLTANPMGIAFSIEEIAFIKRVPYHQHPLVLQISADCVLSTRQKPDQQDRLRDEIRTRVSHFLTHEQVLEGRRMALQKARVPGEQRLNKPLDLILSILIPIIGIGLFMLEFGLLMHYLNNFQAVLLGVATAVIGFAVLVFAGRSIAIIGETTFYKLFSSLIGQIPLLANLLSAAERVGGVARSKTATGSSVDHQSSALDGQE